MQNIELNQAKECLPELIEQAITGNEVIITKNGEPIVKLVAIGKTKKRRRFGSARNLIKIHDDFDEPLEDFQEYM
jgi:prevent-host-death family protein